MLQRTFNGEKWRVLTPIILTVLTIMAGNLVWCMRDIRISLNNHLTTDMSVISGRLGRIEERLGIPPR